ncbi:HET-domain-containing protein, partial [Glonium stellatum]
LLPVPANLAHPGDRLCDTCKALKLTASRFVILPGDLKKGKHVMKDPTFSLGLVKDVLKKNYCPLCRLAIVAIGGDRMEVPALENGEPTSIVLTWDTDIPMPNPCAPKSPIRVLRPHCETVEGKDIRSVQLSLFQEISLLANDCPVPATTFLVRPIPQDKIDFSMVRNWLSLCGTWHGDSCNNTEMLEVDTHPADEISAFRFVDVIDNCLVHGRSNSKYAALSYVWGRARFFRTLRENVEKLQKPGAFKLPEFIDKIPWTIRDAIEAVREIGLRYLWVDSLCIVQDDTTGEKADAISKMDLVYGAAFVTIIAATGDGADAGLPGVRSGTRGYRQPIEEVMPGLRLAVKPVHSNYMKDSVYISRGWTFQENLFSPRSLRFVGGQIVFKCRRADEWREDVVFENSTGIVGSLLMPREKGDIGKLEGLIQSYSDLSLTYDSDIYNAFAGISKYITSKLKSNLCHGIPEAHFDWFLLWTALKPQKRRESAPSWSWSGWTGQSWSYIWKWYTGNVKRVGRAQRNRTWIIWYQR